MDEFSMFARVLKKRSQIFYLLCRKPEIARQNQKKVTSNPTSIKRNTIVKALISVTEDFNAFPEN